MRITFSHHATLFAVTTSLLLPTTFAFACPFCASGLGKSLTEQVAEGNLVLYGKLRDATFDPAAPPGTPNGSTVLEILERIKDHPSIKGSERITLSRYIPMAQRDVVESLVIADVKDGQIDPYLGQPVTAAMVEYLRDGAKVIKAEPQVKLGYFFRFLNHPNEDIALDAYKVFAIAPFPDVKAARAKFDAKLLASWLRDPKSSRLQMGLFGVLLGVCGEPKDAAVLREIIDTPSLRPVIGIDGILGGYAWLDPRAGEKKLLDIITAKEEDPNLRLAALRAITFLRLEMADRIDIQKVFSQMESALTIPEIADLVIEEFQRGKYWKTIRAIAAMYSKPEFQIQVVRRRILRYALECPGPEAASFIQEIRAKEPQLVADVEEIMALEKEVAEGNPLDPAVGS